MFCHDPAQGAYAVVHSVSYSARVPRHFAGRTRLRSPALLARRTAGAGRHATESTLFRNLLEHNAPACARTPISRPATAILQPCAPVRPSRCSTCIPMTPPRPEIADGEPAIAETVQGRVRMKAAIRDDMQKGLVRVPHGWWLPEVGLESAWETWPTRSYVPTTRISSTANRASRISRAYPAASPRRRERPRSRLYGGNPHAETPVRTPSSSGFPL